MVDLSHIPLDGEAKRQVLRELAQELLERRTAGLALYRPMPEQERFHACPAKVRVFRGGVRSGKSMACYAEVARAALGQDPYGKYPTNRPLDIWVVCYEESNIGRTVWRYLFCPGAYWIIEDPQTKQLRAWDPALDAGRESERMPARPFIPERCVRTVAWRFKKDRIFSSVIIDPAPGHPMCGTTIRAFSSGREPPQSDPVDLVMIDEDLKQEAFVPELISRLADRGGKLIWAVFPHSKNNALIRLHRQAEQERGLPNPSVVEFRGIFSANPYLPEEERRRTLALWTEEERKSRDQGEFALDSVLVYPEFSPSVHALPIYYGGTPRHPIDSLFPNVMAWMPPQDWTIYVAIDPGHTVGAALFIAIPPPEVGDFIIAYDEVYIRNCDVKQMAQAIKRKLQGRRPEAFYIDMQGARVSTAGVSYTAIKLLENYFRELGIASVRTGSGFYPGSTDVAGRIAEVRDTLITRELGGGVYMPKFLYLQARCPNLEREFLSYRKRVGRTGVDDTPVAADNHLMDCLGYLIAAHPKHVVRPTVADQKERLRKELLNRSKKQRRKNVRLGVLGGDSP